MEAGGAVSNANGSGNTALHLAAEHGHMQVRASVHTKHTLTRAYTHTHICG